MTFSQAVAGYFVKNLALDVRGGVLVSAGLMYALPTGWFILRWLLRKRVARQKARLTLIDQLAQTPEIKLHAWHLGMQYPVEKAEMAEKLRARGYPVTPEIIDEAIHSCLQKKFIPELAASGWMFAIGRLLDRWALWLALFFGSVVLVDLVRMWNDPEGRLIFLGGLLFVIFSYFSYGVKGVGMAFVTILIVIHLSLGVVRPLFAETIGGIHQAYREAMLQQP